ncbi:MAG: RsbRD N-terminal domain-containing protein [bacterium]
MTLRDVLREKKEAVHRRWLDAVWAEYTDDVSAFLRRENDRFANPVGHALRTGTRALLDDVVEGSGACPSGGQDAGGGLDEIMKIRAAQDFTPSGAVSFIFGLKDALRAEMGSRLDDPLFAAGILELEAEIDRAALRAFDMYERHRERIRELRVNEARRSVYTLLRRVNRGSSRGVERAGGSACAGDAAPGGAGS